MRVLTALLLTGVLAAQQPSTLPAVSSAAPARFVGGPALDTAIEDAIQRDEIPGAVVLIGYKGQIVYQKAYGQRAVLPRREPMTLNTIFDIASLTKVVATTSAIMKLVEQGKIRIGDRVTQYLPEFQGGKSEITVRHLLTHFSGLRPDVDLEPVWSGYQTGIQKALTDRPVSPPGTKFVYSDINFVLLGEIVQRVSGQTLSGFVQEEIFGPLGMKDTMFQPREALRSRIAPTEIVKGNGEPLRGVVHDPTARYMGGVAGHAGVFSTAADLAKFAEMMLGMGQRGSVRIFSPMTVRAFTTPQTPPDQPVLRGLGWDISSPFSGNRGDLFALGSYGHTGFTGTSMWIDPYTDSYVILLTNAVHPRLRPAITSLRGRIANGAAAGLPVRLPSPIPLPDQRPLSLPVAPEPNNGKVLTGIDVLIQDGFAPLKGKRVGLITNHTGMTRDGRRNIDAMVKGGVNLTALFSPEHGIMGTEDHENIGNSKDEITGIPVYSLYSGPNRKPTDSMLRDIEVLVFDIQDVGARFYTYVCTMRNVMEEAARRKIPFVVLDRPNPITGEHVEGPVLDPDLKSFIGCMEIPVRHGMTVGELAQMSNASLQPKADLRVIKMTGWQRSDWFDATGLQWVDPSPNMRSLNAALLYPGIAMLEGGQVYSVGRGTDAPFEQVGADWMRGQELADYLNARRIPGIRVYATRFRPSASNFAGKMIEGVRFVITDRNAFNSTRFGIELGAAIGKLFPGKMNWAANEKLTGNRKTLMGMQSGEDPNRIQEDFTAALERFRQRRAESLLY